MLHPVSLLHTKLVMICPFFKKHSLKFLRLPLLCFLVELIYSSSPCGVCFFKLFFLGDWHADPLFIPKHIRRAVCGLGVAFLNCMLRDHQKRPHHSPHLVQSFRKRRPPYLLRPTLLPAAMIHSSLRELPASNRLRLIFPDLILAWALLSGTPAKIYH